MKPCNRCFQEYPDDRDHFREVKGVVTQPCLKCANKERRDKRANNRGRYNSDEFIQCRICGDLFVQITDGHVRRHNISLAEYRTRFPDAPIISSSHTELLSSNAADQWRSDYDRMSNIVKHNNKPGKDSALWKGGYEAGVHGGHPKFRARRRMTRAFGERCMIPGCDFDFVVHNHHIIPRREGGGHQMENCILLCPNHHALADAGVLSRDYLQSITLEAIKARRKA